MRHAATDDVVVGLRLEVVPDNCRMLPTSLSTRSNAFLFFHLSF